jgi:pimeloyl-ACP methyl ester carboxylesterase
MQDLLMIPGLLCTAELYAPQMAVLGDLARISVGRHTGHDTMAAIAASILAEAPPTFALCGLSMGGYIAFEIMRQAPRRVTRLALLDTQARSDTPEGVTARRQLVAGARSMGMEAGTKVLMPRLVHPRRVNDAVLVATVARMADAVGVENFAKQQEAIGARADSRPGLGAISVPTLVLVGREDALTPVALAEEMAAGIPGSVLRIIEDCGHLSTLEQPGPVNDALRAWLGSV